MIIDARSLPDKEEIDTDVCIVGAGTAGFTLAQEFLGEGFRVCLLESGGFEPDRNTQVLSWSENVGLPYYPLDTITWGPLACTIILKKVLLTKTAGFMVSPTYSSLVHLSFLQVATQTLC